MTYSRVNGRVTKLLDEGVDGSLRHVALGSKADDGPGSKFRASADLLPNQIPNTILRSQQALRPGALVVLDLRSRKDASDDGSRLVLDFKTPVFEILGCQMG